MDTITLRTSTGMPKGTVEVVGKANVAYRTTHNHDGRYLYTLALGTDGTVYETKSSGGYRVARNQSRARARYHAVNKAQGAQADDTPDVLPDDPELWHGSTAPRALERTGKGNPKTAGMPSAVSPYAVNSAQGADD